MGDSDTIMAQATAVDYNDSTATAVSGAGHSVAPAAENPSSHTQAVSIAGELVSSDSSIKSADTAAQASDIDPDNVNAVAYDDNGNLAGPTNSSPNSTQVAVYDSSLNGNVVSEASITQNGVASVDGIGSAALHQPLDGSGI